MNVTAIKQQAKNPERVSIFLNGKYGFSLSLNELATEKLKNGDEVDKANLVRLKKVSEDGKLRARALEWLLNRPHSTREFKDYMFRKKANPSLTESLELEFSQKGYLDDISYGAWLVGLRQRAGKSNRAITAELFKKGLSRQDVARVMEGQEESEYERLKLLISKKSRLPRYQNDPQKLAKYLVSQGFSWQDVKEALALDNFKY